MSNNIWWISFHIAWNKDNETGLYRTWSDDDQTHHFFFIGKHLQISISYETPQTPETLERT